jgi:hypothetical protein
MALKNPEQAKLLTQTGRRSPRNSKYGNRKVWIGKEKFDSIAEAGAWIQLQKKQAAGLIQGLERQVGFAFACGTKYIADFVWMETIPPTRAFFRIVADVKGGRATRTQAYRIKRKLLKHEFGYIIREIEIDAATARTLVMAAGGVFGDPAHSPRRDSDVAAGKTHPKAVRGRRKR